MGWFDTAVAGIAGAVAPGLAGPLLQYQGQQQQNTAQWDATNVELGIQEQMASTGYQRTMQDMEKAGLNPMLAAQNGPESGSTGLSIPSFGSPLSAAANSAMSTMGTASDLATKVSQIGVNSAQADKLNSDADYSKALTAKTLGVDTDKVASDIQKQSAESSLSSTISNWLNSKEVNSAMKWLKSGPADIIYNSVSPNTDWKWNKIPNSERVP